VRSLHTPQYAKYVAVLIDARNRVGITQHQLAKRLGKPQSFVSKYERSERRLDVPEFIAVAKAIGVNAKTLLGRIEAAIGP